MRLIKQTPSDPSAQPQTSSASGSLASLDLGGIKKDTASDLRSTAKIDVKAVLSYSEYLDGKWQPVKTSDPDSPADVGHFDPSGRAAFLRASLQLRTSGENGELRVSLSGAGSGSFTLANSHSAPVGQDTFIIEFPPFWARKHREISTGKQELSIAYHSDSPFWMAGFGGNPPSPLLRSVITGRGPLSAVTPNQSLTDPWGAPFFVSDTRSCFYVETMQKTIRVPGFGGYGLGSGPGGGITALPPFVWQKDERFKPKPDLWNPVVANPGFGVVDPGPVEATLSEDAFINRALGTTGTIRYGRSTIGPAGQLTSGQLDPGQLNQGPAPQG